MLALPVAALKTPVRVSTIPAVEQPLIAPPRVLKPESYTKSPSAPVAGQVTFSL